MGRDGEAAGGCVEEAEAGERLSAAWWEDFYYIDLFCNLNIVRYYKN